MKRIIAVLIFCCSCIAYAQAPVELLRGSVVNSDPLSTNFQGYFIVSLARASVVNTCVTPVQVARVQPIRIAVTDTVIAPTQLIPTSCLQPSIPYYVQLYNSTGNLIYTDNWYVPQTPTGTIYLGQLISTNYAPGVTVSLPTPIMSTPPGNQTITQPGGTSLTVNNLVVTNPLNGSLTGSASLNVLKAGDTMTGPLIVPQVNSVYYPSTFSAFQLDLTACGSSPCSISIGTNIAVTANTTIPANVRLIPAGGQLQPATSVTLTFSAPSNIADTLSRFFGGAGSVAGLTTARPEWFGSTSIVPAINALSTSGGTIQLQAATYQSGCCASSPWPLTGSHIDLEGSGKSQVNSGRTALTGGTIIQGPVWVNCNSSGHADYFTMRNVGIDMGSNVTTGLYGGTGNNAFVMDNNGQAVGGAQCQSPVIEHVTTLNSSASAAFHAFLFENAIDGYLTDIVAVYGTHGIAFKATNSTLNGFTSIGHTTDCLIVKADNYAPAAGDTVSNGICQSLAQGDNLTGGIVMQGESSALSDITLTNMTMGWTTFGIELQSFTSSLTNINISNVTVNYGGSSSSPSTGDCFNTTGTTTIFGVNVANFTCSNYAHLFNITAFIQNGSMANVYGNSVAGGSVFSGILSIANIVQSGGPSGFTSNVFASSAATSVISIAYPQISGSFTNYTSVSAGALITVFPIMNTATGSINTPLFTGGPVTLQGIPSTTYDLDVITASGATHAFQVGDNGNSFIAGSLTLTGGSNQVYRCTSGGALPAGALTTATGNCGASTAVNLIVP